jgi:hypothetical protein
VEIKKVVLVGEFTFSFYEPAFAIAMRRLGIEVFEFKIKNSNPALSFIYRIEDYFSFIGPITRLLHYKFKRSVNKIHPDLIFFWRPTLINPSLLKALKSASPSATIVSYNNDNPFGKAYQQRSFRLKRLWIHFKKSIPFFDVNIVYRNANINDYNIAGSIKTILFPPAFIPELIPDLSGVDYIYDVVFIGYAEQKRLVYLNFLLSKGIQIKIFGTGWDLQKIHPSYQFGTIIPAHGKAYYQALRSARINLAFLSDLNEDVYTRRNFEIPGMGGLMLSERTKELATLFSEGKEAFFFSNHEELLEHIKVILADQNLQNEIRKNAKNKCFTAGYDIDSRVRKLLNDLET